MAKGTRKRPYKKISARGGSSTKDYGGMRATTFDDGSHRITRTMGDGRTKTTWVRKSLAEESRSRRRRKKETELSFKSMVILGVLFCSLVVFTKALSDGAFPTWFYDWTQENAPWLCGSCSSFTSGASMP